MKLSREEMETVIRSSAADDVWDVWTCDPRMMRLLKRRGYAAKPDHQGKDSVSVRIPLAAVVIRSNKPKRQLSPEERLKRTLQLKNPRVRGEKTIAVDLDGQSLDGKPEGEKQASK